MSSAFEISVQTFWATHFFYRLWRDHAVEAPAMIDAMYDLKSQQAETNIASGVAAGAKSAAGLYESDFNLFDTEHPGLLKLKRFIEGTLQAVVAKINGAEVLPERIQVDITESWFHITNQGGFHDTHGHGQCSWCGIYYLQVGQMEGPNTGAAPNGGSRFYSPFGTGGRHFDYGNKYLTNCYVDPPVQDGALLLFPSYLQHSGLPYRGTLDRIVIAFNTQSYLRSSSRDCGP